MSLFIPHSILTFTTFLINNLQFATCSETEQVKRNTRSNAEGNFPGNGLK